MGKYFFVGKTVALIPSGLLPVSLQFNGYSENCYDFDTELDSNQTKSLPCIQIDLEIHN